jgi:hypothetical protein
MGHNMHAALQVAPTPSLAAAEWIDHGSATVLRTLASSAQFAYGTALLVLVLVLALVLVVLVTGESLGQYDWVGGGNATTHRVCITHIYGSATILGDLLFLFPSATSIGGRTGAGGPRTGRGKRGRDWHVSLHQGLCGGSSPGRSVRCAKKMRYRFCEQGHDSEAARAGSSPSIFMENSLSHDECFLSSDAVVTRPVIDTQSSMLSVSVTQGF